MTLEGILMDRSELTPPYGRYLIPLVRPFPNWDFFFIKKIRQRAVRSLHLEAGRRVLDAGCGPGGTFPYLWNAVGPTGEVVGVEISPETLINARRRIEANGWKNVQLIEGNAKSVQLPGMFDGLVMFAAPDIYSSLEALDNLVAHLNHDARVVVFGAKLSRRVIGAMFNALFRMLMKLSFSSTPPLEYEPLSVLRNRLVNIEIQEYLFGCMFLACGSIRTGPASSIDPASAGA